MRIIFYSTEVFPDPLFDYLATYGIKYQLMFMLFIANDSPLTSLTGEVDLTLAFKNVCSALLQAELDDLSD